MIWKKPQKDLPPLKCSKRVVDSEEAAVLIVELRNLGMLEVGFTDSASPCGCRSGQKFKPAKTAEPVKVLEDGKMRAAGDRLPE